MPPRTGRRAAADPFRFDRAVLAEAGQGGRLLAGADEVGRGCLAGPLVCAAVILDYARPCHLLLQGLRDSKDLSPAQRDDLSQRILKVATRAAVVAVSPASIDGCGLHRSNLAALARALETLGGGYEVALVDGFQLGRQDLMARRVVGGDHRSAVVAAASVVAKVCRDRLMRTLHEQYPQYGFDRHVGYGTSQHRKALEEHGTCPLHRLSFAGVGWRQLQLGAEAHAGMAAEPASAEDAEVAH